MSRRDDPRRIAPHSALRIKVEKTNVLRDCVQLLFSAVFVLLVGVLFLFACQGPGGPSGAMGPPGGGSMPKMPMKEEIVEVPDSSPTPTPVSHSLIGRPLDPAGQPVGH
jgi:hypothetical protein